MTSRTQMIFFTALFALIGSACGTHPKEENNTQFIGNESSGEQNAKPNTETENTNPVINGTETSEVSATADNVTISDEEKKMYQLFIAYRQQNDLPIVPLSKSLTFVAQQHCYDLYTNQPDKEKDCNAHSWSANGNWTACCYTSDHKQAKNMWNKPSELTDYTGNGYEIACGSSKVNADYPMTADYAIKSWQGSSGHNEVMLNQGAWGNFPWESVGVGIYKGFACIWFGTEKDPAGYLETK